MVHWISFKHREKFVGLILSVLKESHVTQKIHQENFRVFSKICETTKFFSYLTFVVYDNIILMALRVVIVLKRHLLTISLSMFQKCLHVIVLWYICYLIKQKCLTHTSHGCVPHNKQLNTTHY